MNPRTRFSPSPTGMIHLGNARAALFSALFAKKHDGVFILRIEDTDLLRSKEQFIELLQRDLHWLGIYWQEGPNEQNHYGPYLQSQRQEIYAKYYKILEEKQVIYPCFCTDQTLNLARKIQLSRGQAPRYAGTCRHLTAAEMTARLAAGEKPAWRFAVPNHTVIDFVDLVKGPQQFKSDDIGDFVVRRADGTAPFLFCNAIDDAEMRVSHVLRGEDHLANTPRQIMLLNILELPIPQYGHLSLIVGDDGAPLSKRHGSFSLEGLREQGYLPQAVMNYLTRLGHACEVQHLLDFEHLAMYFYLEKLSRSPAKFDRSQLKYWQKIAVQALDQNAFWQWLGDDIRQKIPTSQQALFAEMIKANIEFPADASLWADIFFNKDMSIEATELACLREAGAEFFNVAESAVVKHGIQLPSILAELKQSLNVSGKKLFMPLRIALTGKAHGPELAQIAELLGSEKMQQRLNDAAQMARGSES